MSDYNQSPTAITISPPLERALSPKQARSRVELPGDSQTPLWGEDGFGFKDVLDIINPLQHIPGLSTLYRHLTGDDISPGARVIGGTLLGGLAGLVASLANVASQEATGGDVGENAVAFVTGQGESEFDAPADIAGAEDTSAILAADASAPPSGDDAARALNLASLARIGQYRNAQALADQIG